jgi:hypothetical protein
MPFAVELLRSIAALDRIAFKKHSILRMRQRNITVDDVKWVLSQTGGLIEEYPADRPLPSGLILGYTKDGRALHLVIALDEAEPMIWVITVYEPNLGDWEEGFERRRES